MSSNESVSASTVRRDSVPGLDRFFRVEKAGARLTLRRDVAEALLAMGIEQPQSLAERHEGEHVSRGRGTIQLVPFGTRRLVVRHCRRGGMLAGLLRDNYFGRSRALHELKTAEVLLDKGVLTAQIVAVVQRRSVGPLFKTHVVSLEIDDAVSGGDYLKWFPPAANREVLTEKRDIIEAVAKAVRRFHDAGFVHGDLNVNNLLLRREGGCVEVYFLDLDGTRAADLIGGMQRRHELMRLNRSVAKMHLEPSPVDDEDRLRFLRLYCGRDSSILHGAPRELLGQCDRQVKWHRILWRLFGRNA